MDKGKIKRFAVMLIIEDEYTPLTKREEWSEEEVTQEVTDIINDVTEDTTLWVANASAVYIDSIPHPYEELYQS